MWDAATYEVQAIVKRDGQAAGTVTLSPGKLTSSFEGEFETARPGTYEVVFTAFDPANGNAGVDLVTFTVQ